MIYYMLCSLRLLRDPLALSPSRRKRFQSTSLHTFVGLCMQIYIEWNEAMKDYLSNRK